MFYKTFSRTHEINRVHYLHSLFVCDNFLICNKKFKTSDAAVHKVSEPAIEELLKSHKSGDTVKSSRCKAHGSRKVFYSFSSCFFMRFVVAIKCNAADGLFTKS
jgi:hypothetical protein